VFCRNIVEEWMFCRNARTSFVVSGGVGEAVEILGRSAEMQNGLVEEVMCERLLGRQEQAGERLCT
jgi:hypothetical protein